MIKVAVYRTGRAVLLSAVLALSGLVAGQWVGDAAAATIEVGGKRGFKTISSALKSAKPGDVVVIKPGIYPGGFNITRNVVIKAESGAVITLGPKQSIIIKGVSKVELVGLKLSSTAKAGAKSHATMLWIQASSNVVVRNCHIAVAGGWGASIKESRDIRVENCQITGPGIRGIMLEGERILLRETTVTGFNHGVVIKAGNQIVVTDNLIDANNTGVFVGGGLTDIVGNTVNGPGVSGIDIRGGDVMIANNAVRRYQHGIFARVAGRGEIKRNTLGQNSNNGLVVGGPKYMVSLNTVSYNAGNGIYLYSKGKWPAGEQARILQNVVSSNRANGIIITGGVSALIRQNLLENNFSGVNVGKGTAEILHNTIVLNTGYGVRMTPGADTKLQSNIIANNQQGVYAYADAKLQSDKNVIYGHILGSGFQLYDANHVKQDWLPTLSGEEILLQVMPARDLRVPGDLDIDPGFVKLGSDYRLRQDSDLLKHYKTRPLPGAFPAIGTHSVSTGK